MPDVETGFAPKQELVEIPKARPPFEIWATIKKSSKYYNQGVDPNDPKRRPVAFKISAIMATEFDGYDFKGGLGGAYRREDLQLWVKVEGRLKKI